MTADRLRAAATRLREVAEAATPGPWERFGMAGVAAPDWEIVDERRVECECGEPVALTGCATNADATYIATMAPPVALAMAMWLDETASRWDWVEERDLALATADAILGTTS